jgi:phosphocarrier protein HPr
MLERELSVTNALGLHARAAAKLVRLANSFKCRMTLMRHDTGVSANARSILSVLYLAAGLGTKITLTADGVDEREAVEQVTKLFGDKFGED